MNNVELAWVIILSVGFLVLIVLSIILVSLMIGVMRSVRRISQRAEEATANISELAALVGKKVAPFAMSAAMAAAMRRFRGKKE